MGEVVAALGELLLKALPTFVLVVLLHFYLKAVYFRPMQRMLEQRYEATEGARRRAEESLAKASEKAAEYEAAVRTARGEIYREREEFRARLRAEQADTVRQAKLNADTLVREAKQQLSAELSSAKATLERHTETLANQIVQAVLPRRAA